MKKIWGILFAILVLAVIIVFAVTPELRNSVLPSKAHNIEEAQEVKLELVYEGTKPEGVGSVRSFTITNDYFVIAARPAGSAEEGGEKDNQLILISRDGKDVTRDHISAGTVYQLGHANGITYNPDKNELLVVGVPDEQGNWSRVVRIDATTFKLISTNTLPCYSTGISYNDKFNYYMIRYGKTLYRVDNSLGSVQNMFVVATDFTSQDMGYHNGYTYLCNWVSDGETDRAKQLQMQKHQNVIYKVDASGVIAQTFIIKNPLLELEGIDFADNTAYVLMNGVGDKSTSFFIYRVNFSEADLK